MNANFTLTKIFTTVCDYYQITAEDISSSSRKTDTVKARQMYCYVAREFSQGTLKEIGKLVKFKHDEVIYSIKKIESDKSIYKDTKHEFEEIISMLFNELNEVVILKKIDLLQLTENYSRTFI